MGPIMISLGMACFVTVCLTMVGRQRRPDYDDTWIALGLVGMWCVGGAWMIFQEGWLPANSEFVFWSGPLMDLPFGLWVASRHFRRRADWKRAIIIIVALQMTCHVAFGLGDKSPLAIYGYKAALNLTSVAQLIFVASSGVSHGIRRILRSVSPGVVGGYQRYVGSGK